PALLPLPLRAALPISAAPRPASAPSIRYPFAFSVPMTACATASRPIGVYDSGVGGLSVLRAIRAALPCEPLIYVADSAHVPYGGARKSTRLNSSHVTI